MSMSETLVIISHYEARSRAPLNRLLASLTTCSSGAAYDVALVINRDASTRSSVAESVRTKFIHTRENTGMNIGAWEHGWRASPGYSQYLFLQDECSAVREGWLAAYLARSEDASIGLLGESVNEAWAKPWEQLARERAGEVMPDHTLDGQQAERVPLYLECMRRWGVDPGATGRHLRSLAWFARREVLERIGGFPIGHSYGECIAAEIAVSRRVEAAGLRVEQASPAPFHFFGHSDWARARPGAPFTHARSRQNWMRRLLGALG